MLIISKKLLIKNFHFGKYYFPINPYIPSSNPIKISGLTLTT
ncbi:hypothetical protein PROVALCAL_03714 [Providencia alcalifaciens DSM 30120]|uniref:Uncharacterized protein n=1 Tax=Providencia alcalifaciens DSM 30120 TaxID=520999 RepID=B6XK06_9GAMM|nr:hypothetical protein PROVALCAL_03714 [Providencia alcalifaciens DSM 30120]